MNGLPLLSHPPPENLDGSDETSCRKCNKEFNFLFTRPKRCNHCGYAYCSSCTDYQALMPRSGPETGYEPQPVCAYCMDMLSITASSKNKLRSLPLARLRAYMKAYNINTGNGVLEKDDLVDAIINARGPNGCLLAAHEGYYRNNSVPRKASDRQRTRSFFSRQTHPLTPPRQYEPPPGPPPPRARASPPRPPPPQPRAPPSPQAPYTQPYPYHHRPRTMQTPSQHHATPQPQPPPPQHHYPPPPSFRPSMSQTNLHSRPPPSSFTFDAYPPPPTAPPRPRSAAPTVPMTHSTPPPPAPSLDSLLHKTSEEISHLSISTLKSVLFDNRVNSSSGILEKDDLVRKVLALVNDEKRDREIAEREEREEAERMEWARQERERQEEDRKMEERERKLAEERLRQGREASTDDTAPNDKPKPAHEPAARNASYPEKDGLCVICCDAHANMAIIDCGHLALCKGCSEIVMKTSRECPLCRTRIVTEQRLLRIFKT